MAIGTTESCPEIGVSYSSYFCKDPKLEHLTISGDIGEEQFCQDAVKQVVQAFGQLDVLVNNAAEQHPQESIEQIINSAIK